MRFFVGGDAVEGDIGDTNEDNVGGAVRFVVGDDVVAGQLVTKDLFSHNRSSIGSTTGIGNRINQ